MKILNIIQVVSFTVLAYLVFDLYCNVVFSNAYLAISALCVGVFYGCIALKGMYNNKIK